MNSTCSIMEYMGNGGKVTAFNIVVTQYMCCPYDPIDDILLIF